MNSSPSKFRYYKRFINNRGDVDIPGYNSITGKRGPHLSSRRSSADLGVGVPMSRPKPDAVDRRMSIAAVLPEIDSVQKERERSDQRDQKKRKGKRSREKQQKKLEK